MREIFLTQLSLLLLHQALACSTPLHDGSPLSGSFEARRAVSSNLNLRGGNLQRPGCYPFAMSQALDPVPVFLMMPLDTVGEDGNLKQYAVDCLQGAKDVGAEGIMVDVWWGLTERKPEDYDFSPYVALFEKCRHMGLKVQAVMSFHACGGNIGDSVNIPLPSWVLDLEKDVEQLFYRDRRGDASREYISLSCDNASVFPRKSVAVKPAVAQERAKVVEAETKEMDLVNTTIREARVSSGTDRTENLHVAVAEHAGNVTKGGGTESSATQLRTALEVYRDFMAAFRDATEELWRDGTLEEIQVGCGPCGELRYPSYPLAPRENYPSGWRWPGIGELQCYDRGMLSDMQSALGRDRPPARLGEYSDGPDETGFWTQYRLKPADGGAQVPWVPKYARNALVKMPVLRSWSSALLASAAERIEATGAPQALRRTFSSSSLQKAGAVDSDAGGAVREGEERHDSQTGATFLRWYASRLRTHGEQVLEHAREVFGSDMRLAAKVSGIHWLRGHPSKAAEATAGYVGPYTNDICTMLSKTGTVLDFTCFEMRDATQSWFAFSRPEGLVAGAGLSARDAGVHFAGENALFCWSDEGAIEQIEAQCEVALRSGVKMAGFTVLRLEPWLVEENSPQRRSLERFISNMKRLHMRGASRSVIEKLRIGWKRLYDTWMAFSL